MNRFARLLFCVLALHLFAPIKGQGIQFESGFLPSVLAKAKAENKPVFVDVFTTWCRPCQYMDDSVFTQQDLGEYFQKYLVAVQLDAEAGEGIAFAAKYNISAYPTFLILSPDGQELGRRTGVMQADQLKAWTALFPLEAGAINKHAPMLKAGTKRRAKDGKTP